MRKLFAVLLGIFFTFIAPQSSTSFVRANALHEQENTNTNRRVMNVPHRRRRSGQDVARGKHRGIGHAYKQGGKSAGRGGKRFGRNIKHGKPVRGGKELGKGMGGFGKGVGKGTGRTGKKVGRKIKHAVTP